MPKDTIMEDLQVLADRIAWLKGENDRLTIENGLLRAASKEQRELNGSLRVEIKQLNEENMELRPSPSPHLPCKDVL